MAREDLHFRLRIPEELKRKIEAAAEAHGQSMTAEIVARLDESFKVPVSLPTDLVSRIGLYADRQGRSVNEEILRLLEREYPEQWSVDDRMEHLSGLLAVLAAGTDDPHIDQFIHDVQETVEGVLTGRVQGVSNKARGELSALWGRYQERVAEEQVEPDLDEEELEMLNEFGRTEKLAEPLPDPRRDSYLLMDFLPAPILAEITRKLRKADINGAAEVLAGIDVGHLEQWLKEEKLPMLERDRLREERESKEFPPSSEDPFQRDW